jgi:hypothetical protein
MEILTTPAPEVKTFKRRVTDEIKALKPGQSFKTDRQTANSAVAYFRYHKRKTTRRIQPDGSHQVWLIE